VYTTVPSVRGRWLPKWLDRLPWGTLCDAGVSVCAHVRTAEHTTRTADVRCARQSRVRMLYIVTHHDLRSRTLFALRGCTLQCAMC
jgi:hypothetical protein